MKKRFACFLLGFWLAVCTLPAAFALDVEPPMWHQWGFSSKEAMCDSYSFEFDENFDLIPMTDAQYEEMAEVYRQKLAQAYEDDQQYYASLGYDSLQAMVEDFQMADEEEYYQHVARIWTLEEYYWPRFDQAWDAYARNQMGLPASGISVQVNGQYVSFPAAAPEWRDSCVMVPLQPVAQAMGAGISFDADSQTARVTLGARAAAFQAGSTQADGGTLAVAPYEADGNLYVPARALGEALGCRVFWEDPLELVVIVDEARLIASIDRDFTILNRLFQQDPDDAQAYRTVYALAAQVTRFDSLNGDEVYPMKAQATIISQSQQLSVSLELNAGALVDLILDSLPMLPLETEQDIFSDMRKSLENGQIELIIDADEQMLYFKSAELSSRFQGSIPALFRSLDPGKVWFRTPLTEEEFAQTRSAAVPFSGSIGQLLYQQCMRDTYGSYSAIFQDTQLAAQQLRMLAGDSAFVKKGANDELHILYDASAPDAVIQTLIPLEGLRALSADLSISPAGRVKGDFTLRTIGSFFSPETLVTGSLSGTASRMDASLLVHIKNNMKAEVSVSISRDASTQAPPAAPPQGELVFDLDALLAS